MSAGELILVGVGPGDPELLTLKAARTIRAADVVAYPRRTDGGAMARDIASAHIGPGQVEAPFRLPMSPDPAPGQAAYGEAETMLAGHLEAGRTVALLCEGDPLFYGSAAYLAERLAARHRVSVVPGISSIMAAAAILGQPMAARADRFATLPATAGGAAIAAGVRASEAAAILKIGRRFDEIRQALVRAGVAERAVLIEHATRDAEAITPLLDAPAGEKPYFSLILVHPARSETRPAQRPESAAIAVVVLNPSGMATAQRTAGALRAAGRPAEIQGLAARFTPDDGCTTLFAGVAAHLRALFGGGHAIVAIASTGIVIRALAPVLNDKTGEAPVIALADDGSAVVPLLGAHRDGLHLANIIAAAFEVAPAVTTASDLRLGVALDAPPPGWRIADPGTAKPVTAALLAGAAVSVDPSLDWLQHLERSPVDGGTREPVRLMASLAPAQPSAAGLTYHPQRLAVGVGCERGCPPEHLIEHALATLSDAGLAAQSVGVVVSLDRKADEPAIHALAERLGVAARFFDAAALEAMSGRLSHPSEAVRAAVGVPGVAEAAALAAAGPDGTLLVDKHKTTKATCAIAQAPGPIEAAAIGFARGHLAIVGLGPGPATWRTPEADSLLRTAEEWVGYGLYLDLVQNCWAGQKRHTFPLGAEAERVRFAIGRAASGRRVALVSSGDPGIYAMAALAFEQLADPARHGLDARAGRIAVDVAPGVSAAQAAAARIGAPLGHDFALISLSDLLTPWPAIERRITAAAEADFAVAFYNPRSERRQWQLERALAILSAHRPAATPIAVANNVGRTGETITMTTLAEIDPAHVTMLSVVLVGASTSRTFQTGDGRRWMFTPRGYESKRGAA